MVFVTTQLVVKKETHTHNKTIYFELWQCCPTFLTPRATEEVILEAEGRTSQLKSND